MSSSQSTPDSPLAVVMRELLGKPSGTVLGHLEALHVLPPAAAPRRLSLQLYEKEESKCIGKLLLFLPVDSKFEAVESEGKTTTKRSGGNGKAKVKGEETKDEIQPSCEVAVTHKVQQKAFRLPLAGSHTRWVGFIGPCVCDVQPPSTGYLVALSYSLYRTPAGTGEPSAAKVDDSADALPDLDSCRPFVAALSRELRLHSGMVAGWLCEHRYFEAGPTPALRDLRGTDAVLAKALLALFGHVLVDQPILDTPKPGECKLLLQIRPALAGREEYEDRMAKFGVDDFLENIGRAE